MRGFWERLTGATCPGCGQPLKEPLLCPACQALLVPRHLPFLVYLGDYRQVGRLPRALKYRGQRALAELLGSRLALGVQQAGWGLAGVTAVPSTWPRLLARGYNQAELLAQAAARALGLPYLRVLRRRGLGPSQTQKTQLERTALPQNLFYPTRSIGGHWLLVDDVMTSGTTFLRARKALLEAGARRVYGAVIAVKSPHRLARYFL
ncbi:ComF family protein [Meiothermus sp. QL-1]|uniref:ComF family protein n=1 Tax=Meiothermus sp. QL-1 TaxID=2058095 RepID=UPI000E0C8070|nr:phosphoribosyltransferase family protein [Meiothermus sp. QL-1]RDI95630.1 ComF family protein [Meiothermus sp. QL-1]